MPSSLAFAVIQGCWERVTKARLNLNNLLGKPLVETYVGLSCLPAASAASLPLSKALNYLLLLLVLWSCSEAPLDQRQGMSPDLQLYSPSGVLREEEFLSDQHAPGRGFM